MTCRGGLRACGDSGWQVLFNVTKEVTIAYNSSKQQQLSLQISVLQGLMPSTLLLRACHPIPDTDVGLLARWQAPNFPSQTPTSSAPVGPRIHMSRYELWFL